MCTLYIYDISHISFQLDYLSLLSFPSIYIVYLFNFYIFQHCLILLMRFGDPFFLINITILQLLYMTTFLCLSILTRVNIYLIIQPHPNSIKEQSIHVSKLSST